MQNEKLVTYFSIKRTNPPVCSEVFKFCLLSSCVQVTVLKSDDKILEGSWATVQTEGQDLSSQSQKIVTFHVSENGETLVQEALAQVEAAEGEQEFTQIAISTYDAAEEFSVVEQAAEEIHSTAYRYNIHQCVISTQSTKQMSECSHVEPTNTFIVIVQVH